MSNNNSDSSFKAAFYEISREYAKSHKENLIQSENFKKIIDGNNQDIEGLLPQAFIYLGGLLRSASSLFRKKNVPDSTDSNNEDLSKEFTSKLKEEIRRLSDKQFEKKQTLNDVPPENWSKLNERKSDILNSNEGWIKYEKYTSYG